MTVPVTRLDHTAGELRDAARRCGNERQARRLRAIAMILDGHSREEAARSQGMDRQTLRDWVHRYNEAGSAGLRDRPGSGRKVMLDEEQMKIVTGWLEAGPEPEADGVVRWRVKDIAGKIEAHFGVKYSREGARRLLRRLGFRHLSPRPRHPKTETRKQEAFRSDFQTLVEEAAGPERAERPLEIWFQDEARIGQKGMLSRVWARKGQRPRIVRDHRYGYVCLFAAVNAARKQAVGHVADRANTVSMNEHLERIGAAVLPGHHGVVVLDGAGWHKSKELAIPENLTLVLLPPYSPELNPMENVIQFLKQNCFANRLFDDTDALRTTCEQAWDWLCKSPRRIASIGHRDWAVSPNPIRVSQ